MNNDYYTPDISELYVGLECERLIHEIDDWDKLSKEDFNKEDFKEKWVSITLSNNADTKFSYIGDILSYFRQIRVKYLDKEDIESLGFVWYKTHPGTVCMEFEKGEYELTYDPDWNGRKYLRIATDYEGDVTMFAGIIKNKSELIKLLKQLNIK